MTKVLSIVPSLNLPNGVASYAMNYFRQLDPCKIQMDFVVLKAYDSPHVQEIEARGGKVVVMPSPKHPVRYCKAVRAIFQNGHYDVVHSNLTNLAAPYFYYAKKAGVKVRILHSHSTKSAEVKWKEIRNNMLAPLSVMLANQYFACSKKAGDYLFGKRPYEIIPNALDLTRFAVSDAEIAAQKKALGITDQFVMGTVGRFMPAKNPLFAMEVFAEVCKKQPDALYLWAGTGELEAQVKAHAAKLGITGQVRFLGARSDVPQLYAVMDVFFLPSLHEGMPVVGIEAQASGVPVVCADTITTEMKVSPAVTYCALTMPKEQWADVLLQYKNAPRCDNTAALRTHGYDVAQQAGRLMEYYQGL